MNSPSLVDQFFSDSDSEDELLVSIGGAVKPWHRLAIKLHVEGRPFVEIAEMLEGAFDMTEISNVITSDWGRAQISELLLADSDLVTNILGSTELDNIYKLIKLRDGAASEAIQYNAAKTLMHQAGGRPASKQSIESSSRSSDDVTAQSDAIDETISKIILADQATKSA